MAQHIDKNTGRMDPIGAQQDLKKRIRRVKASGFLKSRVSGTLLESSEEIQKRIQGATQTILGR